MKRDPRQAILYVCSVIGAVIFVMVISSCVTPGDLRDVADELAKVEAATGADLEAQIVASTEAIEAIADTVEDRTSGFIDGVGTAGEGGILAAAAALGLNFYRNSRRKKRGEAV